MSIRPRIVNREASRLDVDDLLRLGVHAEAGGRHDASGEYCMDVKHITEQTLALTPWQQLTVSVEHLSETLYQTIIFFYR